VTRRVLALVAPELAGVERACASLARAHRDTPVVARTLLQQALPTTLGLKAAGWLTGVAESRRLLEAAQDRLALQLGGAAGTLAAFGGCGLQIADGMAAELGLAVPVLPWHTSRGRVAALGGALVAVSGALGKIALDIVLLAQTEVAEVREASGDGRGGSSALPHKRNPVGATLTLACARRVQAAATLLLGSMLQEHERAAGAWHAEWEGLTMALASTAGAAGALREVLDGLELDVPRMRANLDLTRELIMAEHVQQVLADRVGAEAAHAIVAAAAGRSADRSTGFGVELADARVPFGPEELARLLDPRAYLGAAGALVDRALTAWSNAQPEL
jgi:3-carboxy-cis,cis-muconate cycloisomerase